MGQDVLTGLPMADGFAVAFEEEIACADQQKSGFTLAVVDLDQFLQVNETHGHSVGDEVLKRVSSTLAGIEAARVFRRSGDEFALLLRGVEKEQAFLRLEKAREAIEGRSTYAVDGRSVALSFTISAGIASYPDDGGRGQDIIRKAEDAIYRAKTAGRNRISLAREERMVTKTSHYTQGQLDRLSALARKEGVGEAVCLREALDDLLQKYGS